MVNTVIGRPCNFPMVNIQYGIKVIFSNVPWIRLGYFHSASHYFLFIIGYNQDNELI